MLEFDAEKHKYYFNRAPIPSVTEVLKSATLVDDTWFNSDAATRGTFIHKACALVIAGKLDRRTIDSRILKYVSAFEEFMTDAKSSLKILESETPRCSQEFLYAGTPDLYVLFASGEHGVIDIKTSQGAPWHELQLAAYAGFFPSPQKMKRYVLELKETGKYSLRPSRANFDLNFKVFLAALTVHNWKTKNMKGKKNGS